MSGETVRRSILPATGLAVVFAAMLAWTWGTWPNAFVDFGRELYVPWRLAEGEVLYRDIAWFNGPLSAYGNALLFAVFGPGLRVLVLANALDLLLLVAILYALLRRTTDRVGAFASCGVFLVLFAFARIDAIGNDNFLTPYSHELTQGIGLSLAALWAFAALRDRPRRAALVSGALLGLVALTKAEPFVAAAAGLACAFVLDARARRAPAADALQRAGLLVAGLTAPVALAFASLCLAMPPAEALRGTLGAWPAVLAGDVASQYFYRATLGLVDVGGNLAQALGWSAAWGLGIGAATLVSLRIRPAPGSFVPSHALYYGAAGAASAGIVFAAGAWLGAVWPDFLRPLPAVTGLLAVGAIALAVRERSPEAGTAAGLLVFSTLLLAKVVLRVRLDQYGFALAMPGASITIAAAVSWLPLWIGHRGGDARLARAVVLGLVAAVALSLLPVIAARIDERDFPLGSGADAFLTDSVTGPVLQQTLAALDARPADATLLVLPEGVMLNYLTRRVNPTGHVNFMPPELLIFGEQEILERLRADPPDLIVLTHKDTREYGVGFFGRGYGRAIHSWVMAGYEPVESFGDPPLRADSHFGTTLLERSTR